MRKNKYGNRKIQLYGILFDSKKEAERYLYLLSEEQAGYIRDLKCHPEYELFPRWQRDNGKVVRCRIYEADFKYFDVGRNCEVVEDVKGIDSKTGKAITDTPMSRFKREILLRTKGIDVEIV